MKNYTLFDYYMARRDGRPVSAQYALQVARGDFARQHAPFKRNRPAALTHGDVFRARDIFGDRRTFVISVQDDDDANAPWERSEGHGPVSEWTTRDKLPGERVLNSDHGSKRYYDFAAAVAIAKRDGWGLSAEALEELTAKLGKAPTRGQIVAAAVERDFRYLESWCNDQWRYVGVCVVDVDRSEYANAENIARNPDYSRANSLWGIESDSADYISETAFELIREALHSPAN